MAILKCRVPVDRQSCRLRSTTVNFPTPSTERVRCFDNYNRDNRNKFKNYSRRRSREHGHEKFPNFIRTESEQYR